MLNKYLTLVQSYYLFAEQTYHDLHHCTERLVHLIGVYRPLNLTGHSYKKYSGSRFLKINVTMLEEDRINQKMSENYFTLHKELSGLFMMELFCSYGTVKKRSWFLFNIEKVNDDV